MKLRINHNSVRLRLTQTELKRFAAEGSLSQTINFSPNPSNTLQYCLIKHANKTIELVFDKNCLSIFVPHHLAQQWTDTDLVGFEAHLPIANNQQLFVLVEKDFKCLDDRPYEDESDNFPNPNEGKAC